MSARSASTCACLPPQPFWRSSTGILFGIVPALQLSRPDLTNALKDGARGTAGAGRQRIRSALVVVEVALAVVLLVGASLFIGSFVALMRIDLGFKPDHVLTVSLSPPVATGSAAARFERALHGHRRTHQPRAGRARGVDHLRRDTARRQHEHHDADDSGARQSRRQRRHQHRRVTPDYHKALRIPLKAGRFFDDGGPKGCRQRRDHQRVSGPEVLPGENAVGRVGPMNDEPHDRRRRRRRSPDQPRNRAEERGLRAGGADAHAVRRARDSHERRSVCRAAAGEVDRARCHARRAAAQRAGRWRRCWPDASRSGSSTCCCSDCSACSVS